MWNDFGGHPASRRHDYLMSVQHERLLYGAEEAPGVLQLYYAWMYDIGWNIENCRRKITEFVKAHQRQASNHKTEVDSRLLKVIHAKPAGRTKWN